MKQQESRGMVGTVGLVATALALVGPALGWLRLVPGLVAFALFALGGLLAVLVSVGTVIRLVRGRRVGLGGGAAILTAAWCLVIVAGARGAPRINDFTTDTADPPVFRHAGALEANMGRDLAYPADFAAVQQACCSDLHPARLKVPPRDALERARRVAERMPGWTITATDADGGTIEAVDVTRVFGFQDDIVIRVRPEGAAESRVDMRSKSRVGRGDMGTNVRRIRAYITALEAAG